MALRPPTGPTPAERLARIDAILAEQNQQWNQDAMAAPPAGGPMAGIGNLAGEGLGFYAGSSLFGGGTAAAAPAAAALSAPSVASSIGAIAPEMTALPAFTPGAAIGGAAPAAAMSPLLGVAGVAAAPLLGMAIEKAFYKDHPDRPWILDEVIKSRALPQQIEGFDALNAQRQSDIVNKAKEMGLMATVGGGSGDGLTSKDPTSPWFIRSQPRGYLQSENARMKRKWQRAGPNTTLDQQMQNLDDLGWAGKKQKGKLQEFMKFLKLDEALKNQGGS